MCKIEFRYLNKSNILYFVGKIKCFYRLCNLMYVNFVCCTYRFIKYLAN